ncbi:class F sortase [Bacillus timonensis]|nr:class F sortase [Bacillus timonensis]
MNLSTFKKTCFLLFTLSFLLGCNLINEKAVNNKESTQIAAKQISQAKKENITKDASSQQVLTSPEIIRDNRTGIIPTHLSIPSIGVEAIIEQVGLLSNGQMGVPDGTENVAWYKYGAKPGEPGNAVLAGHVDSKKGPAVFFYLKTLKVGDEIIVTDKDNQIRTFNVTETVSYPRNDAPLDRIFGYTYRSQLILITCNGVYDRSTGEHSERLVVYADLETP